LTIDKAPVSDDTYTITVTNPTVGYITDVLLTEELRPGVFFVASLPTAPICQAVSGTIICNLGNLGGGLSAGVQIQVDPNGYDLLSGRTSVRANGLSPVTLENPYVAKFAAPPFVLPGGEVAWTIQVVNPTNGVATNVQVVDDVPDAFEILSASSSAGTVTVQGQRVTFRLPLLEPLDAATITLRTRLNDGVESAAIPNRACLTTRRNPRSQCAAATLFRVRALPATGESPWSRWRLPIFGVAAWLTLVALALLRRLIRGRRAV
jgi:uncharacterized repeat protein (TIGR01451 family)